ncbi:hypothetical protein EV368DRAFT_87952 [Lentinula lateritia]|nr:hypothetical protein EV368DRAFT_87952 [Lentinula lateritia]
MSSQSMAKPPELRLIACLDVRACQELSPATIFVGYSLIISMVCFLGMLRSSSIPRSSTSNLPTSLVECGIFTELILLNACIHIVDTLPRTHPLSSVTLRMDLLRYSVSMISIIVLVTQIRLLLLCFTDLPSTAQRNTSVILGAFSHLIAGVSPPGRYQLTFSCIAVPIVSNKDDHMHFIQAMWVLPGFMSLHHYFWWRQDPVAW